LRMVAVAAISNVREPLELPRTGRPKPLFIAENPALDLLNSVAAPWGAQIEWLGGGQDLLAWVKEAGLVSPGVLKRFREETSPEALDEIAAQARELREWFRAFVSAHAGRRLEPSALAELHMINSLLACDETYHQIESQANNRGISFQQRRHRRWRTPKDLLLSIAEAMGDVVCHADFERIRNCEGPTCTMWFHDVSKNHTRRWCTMAVCGNRAKAAAHRTKRRAAK